MAIKWYHDHLGMIVLHEEINEEQGIREAMLSVRGAPVGSAQVQLMAPLDETSTIAKFIDKRGPGLQQIAYRVSDIDALTERLAPRASGCFTTHRAAALRTPGSTSSIPRMPAASSSNSSSLPPITDGRQRLKTTCASVPRVARCAQHGECQCRRSSTACRRDRPATPPNVRCRSVFRGRIRDSGRFLSHAPPATGRTSYS